MTFCLCDAAVFTGNCRATFTGPSARGQAKAGEEVTAIIECRDVDNNPITVGGVEPGFNVVALHPKTSEFL